MINKVYFFGTSHTAGGGFEFESNLTHSGDEISTYLNTTRGKYIKDIYTKLFPNEEYTQYNFSFPGQFSKLLQEKKINLNVVNISKQGYGNERIYRKFFEIIKDKKFKIQESLFIFEFSDIERKELFYKPINDFIILNYSAVERNFYKNTIKLPKKKDSYVELSGVANTYWYESYDTLNILKNDNKFFVDYVDKLITAENQVYELNRNNIFLLSFLKLNNFNFLISEMHDCLYSELKKYYNFIDEHKIMYYDYNNKEYNNGFLDFVHKNKLLIADETGFSYADLHPGFLASKLISKNIFNYCVRKNYINSDIIQISKKDFIYPTIQNTVI